MLKEVRSPIDAWRHASAFDKARTMKEKGYGLEQDEHDAKVTSPCGDTYYVDLLFDTCSCPDYRKNGGPCKHLMFVALMAAEGEDIVNG